MIRLVFTALISLGLVLAGMPGTSMHVDHPAATAMSSPHGDCLCCETAAHCAMTTCVAHCSQLGPALDPAFRVAFVGHAALSGLEPSTYYGLTYQPPTPPPRV